MIKYIFAVLFFVSHAIPAGSQPATHDARPSVSPPASPTDKPIKPENIDAFSEENSDEYEQFLLRSQKINMLMEKVIAALEKTACLPQADRNQPLRNPGKRCKTAGYTPTPSYIYPLFLLPSL